MDSKSDLSRRIVRKKAEDAKLGECSRIESKTFVFPKLENNKKSFTISSKKSDPRAVFEQLRARGVVCDFREPGSIRLAVVPMYNKFTDVYDFTVILKTILELH